MLDLRDLGLVESLLNRPPRSLLRATDREALAGQRVLITGAAGSVGSELARVMATCGPASLTILDQSEHGLFNLERELNEALPQLDVRPILGDVTRRRSMRKICRVARPHVVYHVAAYKHVGMLERDVCAAVHANTLGTYYMARAARDSESRFVLVSTDKAFWPVSVMGASKRLAEQLTLSLAEDGFTPTVVRFGNVLGSSGSVVELMLDRITRRKPIVVTHPEASRFFMSADEAASLVMLIDVMRTDPGVYWLDMGTPVRILQLARRLLACAEERGYSPVPIEYSGLRPGEKLTEEFPTSDVVPYDTRTSLIYRLRDTNAAPIQFEHVLRELQGFVARDDAASALRILTTTVPEFEPSNLAVAAARNLPRAEPVRQAA